MSKKFTRKVVKPPEFGIYLAGTRFRRTTSINIKPTKEGKLKKSDLVRRIIQFNEKGTS